MKPKIVLTHWVHPEIVQFLSRSATVIQNETRESWPRKELLKHACDADALMVFMPDRIDSKFLDACPKLKVIGAALKGFDNIDVAACTERGIRVTFVPDLLTVPAAELTVGMMIALGRHVLAGDARVRSGKFKGWRPELYGTGLAGETVGILGMGVIGQAIAQRLQGFEVKVLYYDAVKIHASRAAELNARYATFSEIIKRSTYVIAGLPLKPGTVHLFDRMALMSMKPNAFLVNIGRGSVVDEAAVVDALESGRLGGYAADVYEFEDLSLPDRPRKIHPGLRRSAKTLLLPHLGSAVERVRWEISMSAAKSILKVLGGEIPETCLNP